MIEKKRALYRAKEELRAAATELTALELEYHRLSITLVVEPPKA